MLEKTLCFTGHRHLPEGQALEELQTRLSAEIDQSIREGYNTFLIGGAVGWDMLCGELLMKRQFKFVLPWRRVNITVICVVPFQGQDARYAPRDRARYAKLLGNCDDVITLNPQYKDGCFKERNQYMVDRSSKIIAYYDGSFRSGTGQTVRMAERQQLQIINLY